MDANSHDKLRYKKRMFVQKLMEFKGDQTKAAIAAGYNPNRARLEGHELMKDPWVVLQIEEIKKEAKDATAYNYALAMADLAKDIDDAKAANQHSAVAKFREQMIRLNGLFVDKLELDVYSYQKIDIREAMNAGRERMQKAIAFVAEANVARERMVAANATVAPAIEAKGERQEPEAEPDDYIFS